MANCYRVSLLGDGVCVSGYGSVGRATDSWVWLSQKPMLKDRDRGREHRALTDRSICMYCTATITNGMRKVFVLDGLQVF